jgi:dTDP-4-dehydrorhamnose reductase
MEIAILGGQGQFGSEFSDCVSDEFDDISTYPFSHEKADVTDLGLLRETIREIDPDYLINMAAFHEVDQCEETPDPAFRTNGLGARNSAIVAEEQNIPIVFVSSDYVFDGLSDEPYSEFADTNPVNLYGESKVVGENFVRELATKYYIVRVSGLFGHAESDDPTNFIDTMLQLARERDELDVVDDQIFSPTFARDTARRLVRMLRDGAGYGVYHLTNEGSCSWYDLARKAFEVEGLLDDLELGKTTTEAFGREADRPRYSVLKNYLFELEGYEPLPHWSDAVERYLG